MKAYSRAVRSAFLAVMVLTHAAAALGAENDIVSLPKIEMTVLAPVEFRVIYEIELEVPGGKSALIGSQQKAAFIAVLRRDLCPALLEPGKGPEAVWSMRSAVLKAAIEFFRPITVTDVLFKSMSWTGPEAGPWSIPPGTCDEPAKAV